MNAEAKARVRAEEALRAVTSKGRRLEKAAVVAGQELAAAEAAVSGRESDQAVTENAYADAPSDRNAKKFTDARNLLELARLRLRKPQAAKFATDQAVEAWRAETADAEAELERARKAEHLAACRARVTVTDFDARAVAPRQKLAAALAGVNEAAAEITVLFAEANAAAKDLDDAGFPTPPLADFHLIAPFLLAHAERCPDQIDGLLTSLFDIAAACRSGGGWGAAVSVGLSEPLQAPLLTLIEKKAKDRPTVRSELVQPMKKQLAAMLAERTREEAIEARDALAEDVRAIGNALYAAETAAAEAKWRADEEREQHEAEESSDSQGVIDSPIGERSRARQTLNSELEQRREANGENVDMGRTRAHLRPTANDSNPAGMPADHFDRLNS